MLKYFFNKLYEEVVLFISFLLLLITSIFVPPSFEIINSIDFKVLATLFCLMIIGLGLEKEKFLHMIAINVIKRNPSEKKLALTLGLTTALIAMFITNDVALLTIVPITIIIAKKGEFDPFRIVVLVTICANIGSSLLPIGNPQNIFIFNKFNVEILDFIFTMLPFTIIGLLATSAFTVPLNPKHLEFKAFNVRIKHMKNVIMYLILFCMVILSIIKIIDFRITTIISIILFLVLDKKLLLRVDYALLGTFVMFFMVIHNITQIKILSDFSSSLLNNSNSIIITASIMSQFISNVPAAILLSPFLDSYKPLLIGVSIGGMGTMIASLANLISYKFYIKEYGKGPYLRYFTITNSLLFVIMLISILYCTNL